MYCKFCRVAPSLPLSPYCSVSCEMKAKSKATLWIDWIALVVLVLLLVVLTLLIPTLIRRAYGKCLQEGHSEEVCQERYIVSCTCPGNLPAP